ncbi:MAG: 30S ribosomal protein S17 [Pelagibacterales bacterium]|nr:30S ribosomal protein S17 [Pelagibacterales bacterium]|tara:strand:+ start:8233 stop:8475 length:243 start_codon:yes stop_codon:yes gene_type:complete
MPKRILQGTVISDGNDKTIVVNVDRRVRHALYKKTITRSSKFHAHDEGNVCKIGDKVRIIECKPISKKKTWTVISENNGK